MSSFAAFLHVQGVRYPLLTYSLAIHQQTDSLGRPASPTQGGIIDCTLNVPTTDRSAILRWMLSPTTQLDGEVVLMQDVPRTILKSIAFFNAYCVGLTMQFRSGQSGGGSLQMQVRISPQRVAVGPILHDNNWPVESQGAGVAFARPERQTQKSGYSSEDVHAALDKASYVPYIGLPAGISDTALYLKDGNLEGALIAGAGVVVGLIPFGKLIGKGAVIAVKIARRTKMARRLVKNILGSRALIKRVARRVDKAINKRIVRAVNLVRKSKWGKRMTKKVLAIRALKRRVNHRLAKAVNKGINRAVKLTQCTSIGRRMIKNIAALNSLKQRVAIRLQKALNTVEKQGIKAIKRTILSGRLIKNISGFRSMVNRIKNRVTSKLANGIEQGIDVIQQTGRLAAYKLMGKESPLTQMLPDYKEPKICYSMNPVEVKKVMDAVLAGGPYNKDQLLYYHLHRNYFNQKSKVTTLKKTGDKKYIDELGHEWTELSLFENQYHMSDDDFWDSMLHGKPPYSRKFVRLDIESGLGGQFEIVIRNDGSGNRIDAKTNAEFQETYNFRPADQWFNHAELDMNTHNENPNYKPYDNLGPVKVIE